MVDYKTLYTLTKTMTVLLVEDYEPLRKEMAEVLEDLVKTVTCASDGKEALSLYLDAQKENKRYDIIISDIQMPHMNGVEFAKKIREINDKQVIYILSAYTDKEYLLELINIHIAKFITKPVNYDELFSLLYKESQKIDLNKTEKASSVHIEFAKDYVWNTDTRILTYKGKVIELTKHELLLLQFFIEKQGYICSSDDIVNRFYEYGIELSERNVRNLIFKLRKKIPDESIQSVYGLGYKFTFSG